MKVVLLTALDNRGGNSMFQKFKITFYALIVLLLLVLPSQARGQTLSTAPTIQMDKQIGMHPIPLAVAPGILPMGTPPTMAPNHSLCNISKGFLNPKGLAIRAKECR